MLLLICCLCTFQYLWGFCVFLSFGIHCFVPFLVCNYLEEEERAGCFAFVVLRMSCYNICSVALPYAAVGCLQCVIVVFPGHTYLLFLI